MAHDVTQGLIIARTAASFFHDLLGRAARRLELRMSPPVRVYLVQLLDAWARGEAVPEGRDPLAEQLLAALNEPDQARRRLALRRIGDRALYDGGYFAAQLVDAAVDASYFRDVGQQAYGRLASEPTPGHLRSLFSELAAQFPGCARVLAEMAESGRHSAGDDLADLYERWLVTRSRKLAARLRELGVLPVAPSRRA